MLKYRVQASGADQAAFEAGMATINSGLAEGLSAGKLPGRMDDLISSKRYLEARAACADDGRRAIKIVRDEADRFGVRLAPSA